MKIKNKKAFFIFGYSFDILTGSLNAGAASATMLIGVRLNPHLQSMNYFILLWRMLNRRSIF